MFTISTISAFFAASILLALTPGPDNIFVLTQSMQNGRKAGFLITLGLCTGLLFHTALATGGIAALLKTYPAAFFGLKLLGAIYLLYLAYKSVTAKSHSANLKTDSSFNKKALYSRGIIMNITNPKVSLFFIAFLPQFTNSGKSPVWIQMIILGILFITATFIIFGLISQLSGFIGETIFKSKRANFILDKISAVIFILLALHLIVDSF